MLCRVIRCISHGNGTWKSCTILLHLLSAHPFTVHCVLWPVLNAFNYSLHPHGTCNWHSIAMRNQRNCKRKHLNFHYMLPHHHLHSAWCSTVYRVTWHVCCTYHVLHICPDPVRINGRFESILSVFSSVEWRKMNIDAKSIRRAIKRKRFQVRKMKRSMGN